MASAIHKQIYDLTRQTINTGYRKLFPLGMITIVFVGAKEYRRRTERYEEFCRRVLETQKSASKATRPVIE